MKVASHAAFMCFAGGEAVHKKKMWRSGRALECKSENLGSHPGDVAFETNQFCRTSSTFVKVCRKKFDIYSKIFCRDVENLF